MLYRKLILDQAVSTATPILCGLYHIDSCQQSVLVETLNITRQLLSSVPEYVSRGRWGDSLNRFVTSQTC